MLNMQESADLRHQLHQQVRLTARRPTIKRGTRRHVRHSSATTRRRPVDQRVTDSAAREVWPSISMPSMQMVLLLKITCSCVKPMPI